MIVDYWLALVISVVHCSNVLMGSVNKCVFFINGMIKFFKEKNCSCLLDQQT